MQINKSYVHIKSKLNYLKLLDILSNNHVTTVLMQYPMRDVDSLKSLVQSSPSYDKIIFVDNEEVFKEAVKKEGYEAIFSDYYAGDFGHPTARGDQVLAENTAGSLSKIMDWK